MADITPGEVADRTSTLALIDVREHDEYRAGHIESAIHIPLGALTERIGTVIDDPTTEIVLYCATGARSGIGAVFLAGAGFPNVSNMVGGFEQWKAENLAWVAPTGLTPEQAERYNRHLNLPDVGVAGQLKLLESRVLIVGAGGLGSPVALYLAAAGVGTIGIVDHDNVDDSNLQRQILHSLDSVGGSKTESARQRILGLNPDVKVETHAVKLDSSNVLSILEGYDVIVDATDNFPTRYLINDASLHLRIPVVHGSIYRFEGQVAVFDPYIGPCYRCLFELPPPPELAPSCELGGVLGVLPGVIGTLQATEALKLVLGLGEPLSGALLLYDALEQDFTRLSFARRPDCPACGDPGSPPTLVDYDEACVPV
jgi:molybdopterin/thiamine biosynthesis adenylyltransferase/rhodanese-related sulfurtransferase